MARLILLSELSVLTSRPTYFLHVLKGQMYFMIWWINDLVCWGQSEYSWSNGENKKGNSQIGMDLVCRGQSEWSWSYGENTKVNPRIRMDLVCCGQLEYSWSHGEKTKGNSLIGMDLVFWVQSEWSWPYGENIESSHSSTQTPKLWEATMGYIWLWLWFVLKITWFVLIMNELVLIVTGLIIGDSQSGPAQSGLLV